MIRKTTLLVLLCAAALGAGVYYFDWKRGQAEPAVQDSSKPAFSTQTADVVSLTLARVAQPAEPSIRLEKRNGAWEIVRPIEAPADQPAVEAIVEEIVGARIAQTEPGAPDRRKAYGLDPAQGSLEFELTGGAKHTVVLGNKDFTGTSVYALIDGGPNVSLVPAALSASAALPVENLRDKRVAGIEAADIQRVEIRAASGVIVVSRKKDSAEEWTFDAPEDHKGKPAAGSKITSALTSLRAEEVIDRPAASLLRQTAAPAIRAVLTGQDGRQITVRISKAVGDFAYARAGDGPPLYKLKKQVLDNWNWKPVDLVP